MEEWVQACSEQVAPLHEDLQARYNNFKKAHDRKALKAAAWAEVRAQRPGPLEFDAWWWLSALVLAVAIPAERKAVKAVKARLKQERKNWFATRTALRAETVN